MDHCCPSRFLHKQDSRFVGFKVDKCQNIRFFTYAKLIRMGEEEFPGQSFDYIILDEFHRLGAAQWGAGVERLWAKYPDARVLGLSATNIRYLDNQRDMAWELFGGNIASELTLGEAVARGILPVSSILTNHIHGWHMPRKYLAKTVRFIKCPSQRLEFLLRSVADCPVL